MNLSKRLMPEYIRLSSWLMIFMFFLFPLKNILSQDKVYNAPDVSIFSEPEQVFELPGAGDYIGPERLQKYNFSNINDIIILVSFIILFGIFTSYISSYFMTQKYLKLKISR